MRGKIAIPRREKGERKKKKRSPPYSQGRKGEGGRGKEGEYASLSLGFEHPDRRRDKNISFLFLNMERQKESVVYPSPQVLFLPRIRSSSSIHHPKGTPFRRGKRERDPFLLSGDRGGGGGRTCLRCSCELQTFAAHSSRGEGEKEGVP